MKKRIAVVAIAALMAGSLTNVGTVSAAEPTEITFWHYMSEDKEGKFVNEAIEEFNNSQDEVHVTAQYLPREELMKQYTIGVVSGELPDCGMVDTRIMLLMRPWEYLRILRICTIHGMKQILWKDPLTPVIMTINFMDYLGEITVWDFSIINLCWKRQE